jgi:hypothetical protein
MMLWGLPYVESFYEDTFLEKPIITMNYLIIIYGGFIKNLLSCEKEIVHNSITVKNFFLILTYCFKIVYML